MASLVTRAGLEPSEKKLPFNISTSDVEAYLQKKVDIICSKDKSLPQSVDVKIYTTDAGKNFAPFVVVLPTSVLEAKNKGNKDESRVDPIFDSAEQQKTEYLKDPFKKLFGPYTYKKEDIQAFRSNDWRRARGVSQNTSFKLIKMTTPHVQSYNGGRDNRVVLFILDPIRLFHDMLKGVNDKKDFHIEIANWNRIRIGEYRYTVNRCVNKGKNRNYDNQFITELDRKMRG